MKELTFKQKILLILSMENKLDKDFWNDRYENNSIGWDLGIISTPLKEYIDQLEDKTIKILIPGAGNAHEAEYLIQQGFTNVFIIDIAPIPLVEFQFRNPTFPSERLFLKDFFELVDQFDLILEQTFFCAIDPVLRSKYALKMNELLAENGKLVGVLFNKQFEAGPPFGGNKVEYKKYFEPKFEVKIMDECYNSIPPRQGSELFIQLVKK